MNVKTKILTSTAVAVALTGGVGATLALADTPEPSPSPSATSAPPTAKTPTDKKGTEAKKHRGLQARALHGEVTLGGKQHRVVEFQRGTVEKVSPTSVTVKSKDGFVATYTITAQTKVRKEKKAAEASDVELADVIRVVATKDGSTLTAKSIRDRG